MPTWKSSLSDGGTKTPSSNTGATDDGVLWND
jgi:hypothetical protein